MTEQIPEPIKGQPITADWARSVTDVCRRFGAIGACGLVREGPGGIGQEALPENKRAKKTVATVAGPFEIADTESETDANTDETTLTVTMKNPFYQIGGRTYRINQVEVEAELSDGTGFVCLQPSDASGILGEAEVIVIEDWETLLDAQSEVSNYVLPLYQFDEGTLVCDFRKMVDIQMAEAM